MTPSDSHPAPVPEHVAELRRRWEEDPGSRLFLQLAEEYRRLGRHGEAVTVLERGLERHPQQVSAHVALGRARLAAGDAPRAVAALDRALELDPTNLVANKLLVEAHLARGDRDLARQRLDLYLLLNEGDPEADELRRRVGRGAGPHDGEATADAAGEPEPAGGDAGGDGGGDAGADFGWAPERAAEEGGWTAGEPASPAATPPSADGRGEPFGELGGPHARRRYLAALGAGGIFPLEPPPEPPVLETEPVEAAGTPAAAPVEEELPAEPAPDVEPAAAEEDGAPVDERPTATLGELYLAQGHPRQAERIFARVLEREPDHPAAADGLDRARAAAASRAAASGGPLTARELLDEADSDAPPRVALLHAYLARIRRDRAGRAGGA